MTVRRDNDPLAICARGAYLGALGAVTIASLSPAGWVPRVLYSYHLEHFAAFYLLSVSMAAARYKTSTARLAIDLVVLACVLEGLRLFSPSHRNNVPEDWVSDLGGITAALAAMFVSTIRTSFAASPFTPEGRAGSA